MTNETRRRLVLGGAGMILSGTSATRAVAAARRSARLVRLALLDNRYPDEVQLLIGDIAHAIMESAIDPLQVEIEFVPRDVRVDPERFGALVARRRFDVFLVLGEESVRQVRRVAPHAPIVFNLTNDPRSSGIVESIRQPGGNVTGFAMYLPTHRKRWEILREAFPGTTRICVVLDRKWPHRREVTEAAAADAQRYGVPVEPVDIDVTKDIPAQLRARLRGRGIAVDLPFTEVTYSPGALVDCLNDIGCPAIYDGTYYVHWDGLMSYEADLLPEVALYAEYVNLILHGTPAGTIPVRFPSSFTLALNARTAARIGVTFPKSLLKRANLVVGTDDP